MAYPTQRHKKDEIIDEREGPSLITYDKVDEIGYGSFGFVYQYKLKDVNSGQEPTEMAVKAIFKRGRFPSQYVMRELHINLTVNHENVVRTFGVEETLDRILIKMELAFTVLSEIKNKVMKVEKFYSYEFYYLAHQIMAGLAYLHGLNIAHRDVKPSNVLVMVNEANTALPPSLYSLTLKLCDFGASKMVPEETEIATITGTRAYMAPEVVQAYARSEQHSLINYKSADVFSAGVVLYEMWYGDRPFTVDRLLKKEEFSLVFKGHTEDKLYALLNSMLTWERKQRCDADYSKLQLADLRIEAASGSELNDDLIRSIASCNGNMEMVKWHIDSGADVNEAQLDITPLQYVSHTNQLSVAQLLIERGADVNRADASGRTPLFEACMYGHLSVAQLLIERGADINRVEDRGMTPLHYARLYGSFSVAQLLTERGAYA